MTSQLTRSDSAPAPKRLSARDALLAAAAVAGLILANIGVVRALDIALDAIHR